MNRITRISTLKIRGHVSAEGGTSAHAVATRTTATPSIGALRITASASTPSEPTTK